MDNIKALLLTQYERNGYIDGKQYIIDEIIKKYLEDLTIEVLVYQYNEFLDDENKSDDRMYGFDEDFFNEMFSNAYEAARAIHFGNVYWNDNYIKFNGYGNLESISDYAIEREIKEDTDFLNWLFENNIVDYDEDEINEALKEAYKLVTNGY